MYRLLILSGKGGTGKTTIASALIDLSECKAFADCDVDAPNLHLVISNLGKSIRKDYYGLPFAEIDINKCSKCGLCENNCKFEAINDFIVNEYECEGCGVCYEICPEKAIVMKNKISGEILLYRNNKNIFSTAQLKIGSSNSGKLVTAVKKQLEEETNKLQFKIIDGSPGIGCPVIASISGVDYILIVVEPTISCIHDMKRIIKVAESFQVNYAICVNKYDINISLNDSIENYCQRFSIPLLGKIPFDKTVIDAENKCHSIAYYPDSPAAKAIHQIWDNINQHMETNTPT